MILVKSSSSTGLDLEAEIRDSYHKLTGVVKNCVRLHKPKIVGVSYHFVAFIWEPGPQCQELNLLLYVYNPTLYAAISTICLAQLLIMKS